MRASKFSALDGSGSRNLEAFCDEESGAKSVFLEEGSDKRGVALDRVVKREHHDAIGIGARILQGQK